jgi:hypothetical protein
MTTLPPNSEAYLANPHTSLLLYGDSAQPLTHKYPILLFDAGLFRQRK